MDSLTLTITLTCSDGVLGYTVRIVNAALQAAPTYLVDNKILRALYTILGTSLSPAITYSPTDISFFVPDRYCEETNDTIVEEDFLSRLTEELSSSIDSPPTVAHKPPRKKVTPPAPEPPKPTPTWRSGSAGGAAAGAAAGDHIHLVMPDADEDDLEVEMDPDFCLCITQAGTQCSRRPAKGKSVCAQHGRKKR